MNSIDNITDVNEIKDMVEIEEKEREENEALYNKALKKLSEYNLDWTFRSINNVLYKENTSFGQLRSCIYMHKDGPAFDYIRACLILIKAGLVGSKQFSENEVTKLEDRAYEIIEDWRSEFGFVGTLHLLIINQMETKHFFMGTQDLGVINHLSYRNLQKDLGTNLLKEDLEEKVRQAQALNTVF